MRVKKKLNLSSTVIIHATKRINLIKTIPQANIIHQLIINVLHVCRTSTWGLTLSVSFLFCTCLYSTTLFLSWHLANLWSLAYHMICSVVIPIQLDCSTRVLMLRHHPFNLLYLVFQLTKILHYRIKSKEHNASPWQSIQLHTSTLKKKEYNLLQKELAIEM